MAVDLVKNSLVSEADGIPLVFHHKLNRGWVPKKLLCFDLTFEFQTSMYVSSSTSTGLGWPCLPLNDFLMVSLLLYEREVN